MIWLSVLCVCFALIIITLVIKLASIKTDLKSIGKEFKEKTDADTNTPIVVSGSDKTVKKLVADINESLKKLRKQQLRFEKGDSELKNAVTNISHDLRTPLTAIDGYLELLDQTEKSDDVQRYLEIIKNRTEALKQLADELFRYSVIVSPDYEYEKERVNVNAVLEDSIAEHYFAFKQKGIVPKTIMPTQPVSRTLNRAALSRVFSNLISNAIKYSDGDLSIIMTESGKVSFTNMSSDLTEVQVNRLFDRFYTVENARKSTGLGLSIAKVLVEQMNGVISAGLTDGRFTIDILLHDDNEA